MLVFSFCACVQLAEAAQDDEHSDTVSSEAGGDGEGVSAQDEGTEGSQEPAVVKTSNVFFYSAHADHQI